MKGQGLLALLGALGIGGCSLGPVHPATQIALPPSPGGNASIDPITPANGPAQMIIVGASVPARWWTEFHCAALDSLVERALASSNDLQAADATLRQARELAAANGQMTPQVDASYQAQRARVSNTLATPLTDPNQTLYSLHTAQLSLTYQLDLFGGVRSKILSLRAAADVAHEHYLAARNTLVSNLVLAVIQQASLAAQVDEVARSVRFNRDLLAMLRRRQVLGAIGAADVAAQETALATAESMLPPLERSRLHQRALISAYLGVAAGAPLPPLPSLDALQLPVEIPLSLPADIVGRRPDVMAAEAQMRGAGADLGTAIAARLPSIQIGASVGGAATRFSDMFASGNPFWSLIGGVTQPVFHGATLFHQMKASQAALDAAKAQYRGAAIQAFVDLSDALAGLRADADVLDAASRARDAAARNLHFVTRQLELGDVGTLTLLNAGTADAQASLLHVQARAARLSDTVALFLAMGGGA
jgi:NodT family efflux transporter outer membrane factor (OMF) lipoprotein